MSKTAGETRTTSKTGLPSFQQPYAEQVLSEGKDLYKGNTPSFYPGSTVAPFDPYQLQGQSSVAGAADSFQGMNKNDVLPAVKYGLNAYDVKNNPVVADYANAAVRPIFQNFTEQMLPAIRSTAVRTGQLGGSKPGLAEAQAAERTARAAGDVTSNIYNNAYNTGVNASQSTLRALPSVQAGLYGPGAALSKVGSERRGLEQAKIGEDIARYEFGQNTPFAKLTEYANLVRSPFGGQSDTTVTGTPPDKASQMISLIMGSLSQVPGIIDIFKGIFNKNGGN